VPYVPVAYLPQAELLRSAERRWHALRDHNPELKAAVDLQRRLLVRVVDLSRTIDNSRLPRLSLPGRYVAAKLTRQIPAFSGEPIPLPGPWLTVSLVQFCADLAAGGAGESATKLGTAIETGRVDPGSLLIACLARDQDTVRTGAIHLGLAPDLAWLVAELATGPFAHSLQRTLFSAQPGPLADALAAWDQGYCPACGSWPALAEVVDRHRLLRCAFCAAAWERTIYACVYCNEAGEAFATVAPDAERPDRRLEVCRSCGAYLKATDSAEVTPFPLIAIADMETMDLDVAAMDHHFGRPPLREFKVGSRAGRS
jgi:hypothetical protein